MRSICTRIAVIVLILFSVPIIGYAQELHNDFQGTFRAKVTAVISEEIQIVPGTDAEQVLQTIEANIIEGASVGKTVVIESDYLELDVGDVFYGNHYQYVDGTEVYSVVNIDRTASVVILVLIFVGAVVIFGGWQGVRSLLALVGSFGVILYVLLPGILAGWNPILISFCVAAGILFAAIFFTHGFNRESIVAYCGTMIAVLITSALAYMSVLGTDLSGFASEEAVYLNLNTGGSLNFVGLLIGAIIIGVLGVLDDIAVTQAAVVTELYSSNPDITRREVYMRALRIGREHVGALVNTLVLAYAGASLPLLLYTYLSPAGLSAAANTELFATEIVRTAVGSIGLILTVPIVTLLAVVYLRGYTRTHSHVHMH